MAKPEGKTEKPFSKKILVFFGQKFGSVAEFRNF